MGNLFPTLRETYLYVAMFALAVHAYPPSHPLVPHQGTPVRVIEGRAPGPMPELNPQSLPVPNERQSCSSYGRSCDGVDVKCCLGLQCVQPLGIEGADPICVEDTRARLPEGDR